VRRLVTLAAVTVGMLSGVNGMTAASAADDPPLPPPCTGELQIDQATIGPGRWDIEYTVTVPGWLDCTNPQFAVVKIDAGVGQMTPQSIRDTDPSGHTTFTAIKRVLESTPICLVPETTGLVYNKRAVSCAKVVVTGGVAALQPVSPRSLQQQVPMRIWDGTTPPDPSCPSCW
jgi:hypothetical protein